MIKKTIEMEWDYDKNIITMTTGKDRSNRYMMNHLHEDSTILQIIKNEMDDTEKAFLKLSYPEVYARIFTEPKTQKDLLELIKNKNRV